MKVTDSHKRRGVSLLETVLAASLLGGAVMTVCSLAAGSLRSVRLNQEYEKAWDYIERQLVLIDIAGVDVFRQSGQTGGQFESLDGRTWRWNVDVLESEITSLYDVAIRVEWDGGGGQLRRVECRTRLCGKATVVDEQITEDASQTQGTATQGSATQGTTQ